MNVDYRDKSKPITAEDLIRRYNLDGLLKDRKAIQTNRNGLDKTDKLLNNFVIATTKDLENIHNQVDGNIATWFFDGEPTLENTPANEWNTESDKINHLGDLYYDRETGYSYRWNIVGDSFNWIKINDTDITEALALANKAQDTADSKRRVFVATPIPPYDVGDIWTDGKDLFRCRAKRTEGDFNDIDWVLATDYSNDDYAKNVEAVLNQFKETVESDYVTTVLLETTKDSINASVSENTQEIRNITQSTTEIKNDLLNTNEKFNNYATTETVTNQINSVEAKIFANQAQINILNETVANGVPIVKTETGYTFDVNGLNINSTNAKTNSKVGSDGLTVKDNASGNTVLFAGYDADLQETIVKSNNMTVEKYFKVPHARYEKYNNPIFGEGTGCFFVD